MVRPAGLDDHFPRSIPAAGPAHELQEQLEGPFVRPEVEYRGHGLGLEHCRQGQVLEVEPLGYHLGADQNVYFPFGELSQNPRFLLFVPGGVRVEAFYAGIGEKCPQLFLYLLGAVS